MGSGLGSVLNQLIGSTSSSSSSSSPQQLSATSSQLQQQYIRPTGGQPYYGLYGSASNPSFHFSPYPSSGAKYPSFSSFNEGLNKLIIYLFIYLLINWLINYFE